MVATPLMVQELRVLDVLALGPWLMYAARRPRLSPRERDVLFFVGLGTVIVNGALWLQERRTRAAGLL
jgi:hypothetical protein